MKCEWIASSIFNVAFYGITAVMCFAYIPLLLLPRRLFMKTANFWLHIIIALEKNILGLTYEVRGLENLPKTGSYLVAAKHQSAYETFKLHMLFDNPAIILKKELLNIPIWGMYLRKSDVIAIDRSTPERALKSIEEGALRVAAQGRPIVIFPQGTRVAPEQSTSEKPYKPGIARIQDATGLPIIPLALNTGLFWPRSGWLKSGGIATFEFLEPIEAGLGRKALMAKLEKEIEDNSSRLMSEAQIHAVENPKQKKTAGRLIKAALFILVAYSALWFVIATEIKNSYIKNVEALTEITPAGEPIISGFPGKINLDVMQQVFSSDGGASIKIQLIHVESWPWLFSLPTIIKSLFNTARHKESGDGAVLSVEKIHNENWSSLLTTVDITTGPITINYFKWGQPAQLDSSNARFTYKNHVINILESSVKQGDFTGSIVGSIDLKQRPVGILDLSVALSNHESLLMDLTKSGIIKSRAALFMGAGLGVLRDSDDVVRVPITQRDRVLYVGPLPIASLPE